MKQAHRFSGEGWAYHGLTKLTSGRARSGPASCVRSTPRCSSRCPGAAARIFVNSMSDLFHENVPDTRSST
jgi:protein gp37